VSGKRAVWFLLRPSTCSLIAHQLL
jgi:hypothetical protein